MPPDVCQLPLVGGHPALDLVNTLERGATSPHDFLSDPSALLRWSVLAGTINDVEAEQVGRAWRDEPAAAHAGLAAVRDIREGLNLVLLAAIIDADGGTAGDSVEAGAALVALHQRWSGAAARARFVLESSRVRLAYDTVPAMLVPDRIAEAAYDVMLTADLTRVRRCPVLEGGCGWLFLDRSRNGSRRWCRMADCGNVVKARRLTERRRAARPSGS
ncbi:CGNR zinc finger domain-containing protein [Micromonospora sp. NBC_00330]|uniref:CGNR zinc finger domain-containing protein n=1 Tax=Micromonospora sp. NBC_00330 TaxID=2903585 RepID=UPI002E298D82|nr:CGNR zinc finger domain-containing protein [Micromonospora sp. NBC_00330]